MNRIDSAFKNIKTSGKKGLICYLVAGDPDLETTEAVVLEMARSGVDLVELGVPFSDPIADGPVIQAASARSLRGGVTLNDVLSLSGRLRAATGIPLLIMSYFNPILALGMTALVKSARQNGVDGVIVPDLPLEESRELYLALEKEGIHFIYFLSPAGSRDRMAETVKRARGFIYCISVAGTTGARDHIPPSGLDLLKEARRLTDLPLALGFGISTPAQVASLGYHADAAIMGSAVVGLIGEGGGREEILNRVRGFLAAF